MSVKVETISDDEDARIGRQAARAAPLPPDDDLPPGWEALHTEDSTVLPQRAHGRDVVGATERRACRERILRY